MISVIEAIHQPGFEQHLAQVEAVGLALLERHFLLVVAGLGLDFLLLIVVAFDLVAVLPLTFATCGLSFKSIIDIRSRNSS